MFFGRFQARAFLVCLQIRVDELDEAVEVFCCDLEGDGWLVCMSLLGIDTVRAEVGGYFGLTVSFC